MTLTSDDLRTCYLCGAVRPADAVVLLDTYDGGPTWLCRDKAACLRVSAQHGAPSDSASGAGTSSGDFVSFRPDDTATGVRGDAPTRLGAGSQPNPFADPWLWATAVLFIVATLALIVGAHFAR